MGSARLLAMLALTGARAAPDRSVWYELAPGMRNGAITALYVTIRVGADRTARFAAEPAG